MAETKGRGGCSRDGKLRGMGPPSSCLSIWGISVCAIRLGLRSLEDGRPRDGWRRDGCPRDGCTRDGGRPRRMPMRRMSPRRMWPRRMSPRRMWPRPMSPRRRKAETDAPETDVAETDVPETEEGGDGGDRCPRDGRCVVVVLLQHFGKLEWIVCILLEFMFNVINKSTFSMLVFPNHDSQYFYAKKK